MNLRSKGLYWPTTCPRPRLSTHTHKTTRVDALILGAGVAGALAAYELTRAGAKVAIVDSRPVATGSTPASTALLLYELDTPLHALIQKVGSRRACAAYTASYQSLCDFSSLVQDLHVNVDYRLRHSLHLARTRGELATLREEVSLRASIGIHVETLSPSQLRTRFGLNRPGAIYSTVAAEINPLALTFALLKHATARGAHILPRQRIDLSTFDLCHAPFRVPLRGGHSIIAQTLVIATGYETPQQFSQIASLTQLRSTYAVATTPLDSDTLPDGILLWETGDPYVYARTTADRRILIGGEDEDFVDPVRRDALIPQKSRVLLNKLKLLVPDISPRIAFRWSGTFAHTADGLPFIGSPRLWPDIFFALGYGGNGITFSFLAAQILAARFQGRRHAAAALFEFNR